MSQLDLSLLGSFQVLKNGHPVLHFPYEKVKALLAYLMVEAHAVHHRNALAVLLWSDQTESSARSNLRKALSMLRKILDDRDPAHPLLLTTRNTIQVNANYNCTVDVAAFTAHLKAATTHSHSSTDLCLDCVEHLEQAIALYQNEFLSNFALSECDRFEDWLACTREQLHQQAIEVCTQLTTHFEHQQNWHRAKFYAKRQLKLEPWNEGAHQALMRALVMDGQRNAALIQYDRCRQILNAELEVEPEYATVALYEQIQNGYFSRMHRSPSNISLSIKHIQTDTIPPFQIPEQLQASEELDVIPSPIHSKPVHSASLISNEPIHQSSIRQISRDRNRLIQKVQSVWLKGVFERSLYESKTDLELEEHPEALASSWTVDAQSLSSEPLQQCKGTILEVYDALVGTLLILGAPGSGKTTLLLELARSLIERAEQDPNQPIPVVFHLASWPIQSLPIDQWLVEELHDRYQVPRRLAQVWVNEAQVLPLLDGLDEVARSHRESCVAAINEFCKQSWLSNLVVCSRDADYKALTTCLQVQAAVMIQPPTIEQIDAYFSSYGEKLAGVRSLLQHNLGLRDVINMPLT